MKVLIQWATNPPTDFITYDINSIADARRLPRKPSPTGPQVLTDTQGWLAAINIQGVEFTGFDHVGFELINNVLVVTAWNDGPDFGPNERWGQKWTFAPPAPDVRINNAINTVQTVTWYGESNSTPALQGVPVLPYSELTFPPNNQTFHGVWVTDAQWNILVNSRSAHGWREWIG